MNIRAERHTRRRWPYVLLALVSVAGVLLSFLGQVMAGSFSVATTWPPPPGHEPYWHRVATTYGFIGLVSLGSLLVALVALWRRRTRGARTESGRAAS